ncbi:uncharacterized protein LOC131246763 [Magnolia sinica]|uniref:uncharacterized protein LOC131246763 n=1 Tax=Magnolia sinica TaxID=86752 RepID=UPI0026580EF3|nr:uncharacterized protein LOC131246763 [Magnolia sinica]
MRRQQEQDQQSRVIYELCSLLLSILRPPPPSHPIPIRSSAYHPSRRTEVSPAGFASLLLGISLALMLCGSVTFVIGFILMPWVLGLVMFFYFVGLVSNLSGLGRAILMGTAAGPAAEPVGSTVRKEMPGQLLSKLPIL